MGLKFMVTDFDEIFSIPAPLNRPRRSRIRRQKSCATSFSSTRLRHSMYIHPYRLAKNSEWIIYCLPGKFLSHFNALFFRDDTTGDAYAQDMMQTSLRLPIVNIALHARKPPLSSGLRQRDAWSTKVFLVENSFPTRAASWVSLGQLGDQDKASIHRKSNVSFLR